ncbi:hypothetical protein [Haloarcula salina]|uniref:Uncharacterized protein n=1 Tax=Haloarcula salina TaxID=1429914 RepID=A0AA41FYJ4_9EURY|nr:hypothetical protein [Haloarcula salina]MBV0900166.1 hypothetical protein [Haloarcula salina]
MTDQTTLSEFGDDDAETAEQTTAPTPAENAEQIQSIIGLLETLTGKVGTLATELDEQATPEYSPEEIDSDPAGMFQ